MKRFKDAFNGIFVVAKSQRNMKIHFISTVLVIGIAIFYNISLTEWLFLIVSISLVIASEIFNTAIEWIADFIEPNFNKEIGLIKDASAGAVLILAISSIIIGLIIFIPKVFGDWL